MEAALPFAALRPAVFSVFGQTLPAACSSLAAPAAFSSLAAPHTSRERHCQQPDRALLPHAAAFGRWTQPANTAPILLRGFAAAADGRAAALRRLRRAGARASGSSRGREAALARVAEGGGEVERGPAADVAPVEGPADELQVASVVDHPALIVTRPIEWGTVLLGFEQANR